MCTRDDFAATDLEVIVAAFVRMAVFDADPDGLFEWHGIFTEALNSTRHRRRLPAAARAKLWSWREPGFR
ncbi:MAG: hypothetical protein ACRDRR_21150 [Pseudonocardiaceae bacterium]